jgi:ABC-type proline/glycine betaine transport systems, periplasmic components
MNIFSRIVSIFFLVVLTSIASFPVSSAAAQKGKPIRLAYVEWDCAAATTALAKAAIEDRLGLAVETIPVSAAAMWVGVAAGDADAMLTAWLPVTHGDYLKKNKDKLVDLGPLVGGARLGWAVPDYVSVQSMADLDASADKFSKRIVGIDPGAGLMMLSEKAIEKYGIKNLRLEEGSGSTMTAALDDAIRRKEWIVVTAWSPHWMFGRWPLRYLDDPEKVLGGEESIHAFARLGLEKDNPSVYAFLDRFNYANINQLQTLMDWNSDKGADPAANARRFMKENPELVNSWFEK